MKGKTFIKDRVIKLRNPWGKGEWKGKWSDNDKRWTQELREKMNHKSKNDGIFFIDF